MLQKLKCHIIKKFHKNSNLNQNKIQEIGTDHLGLVFVWFLGQEYKLLSETLGIRDTLTISMHAKKKRQYQKIHLEHFDFLHPF